jgi:hypothetical protein
LPAGTEVLVVTFAQGAPSLGNFQASAGDIVIGTMVAANASVALTPVAQTLLVGYADTALSAAAGWAVATANPSFGWTAVPSTFSYASAGIVLKRP